MRETSFGIYEWARRLNVAFGGHTKAPMCTCVWLGVREIHLAVIGLGDHASTRVSIQYYPIKSFAAATSYSDEEVPVDFWKEMCIC